jgi:tight adherence protein C
VPLQELLSIATCTALGTSLLLAGALRFRNRLMIERRVQAVSAEWSPKPAGPTTPRTRAVLGPRQLAGRLGARIGQRWPGQVGVLGERVDSAGLIGGVAAVELLGWKIICALIGAAIGAWGIVRFGAAGIALLAIGVIAGWFAVDITLVRRRSQRRRAILRELPTILDLLVLSLESGMGLDRALRMIVREYRSALSDEMGRVLHDVDLGIRRGEAFERMAQRVGLEELHSVSRAIVQSDELGTSLVSAIRAQSRDVRLSRRRAAEAEAFRAPIKMLVPLVVFILPTLFMLLLGPVGLRVASALAGAP